LDAVVDWKASAPPPADFVREVDARGARLTTPYDGGEIAWHCWGEGRPLVLLHGGYGSWMHWIRNVEALARHYRLLVPDMPGFGESGDMQDPPYGIADALGRGLRQLAPDQQILLAGFSFGSVVGGLIAQQALVAVDTIVIVGGAGLDLPRKPLQMAKWRGVADDTVRREAHRANLATLMIYDPGRIDDLAVYVHDRSTGAARVASRPISRMPLLREALAATNVGVGGIWGEHDATAEPYLDQRRELLQRLRPGSPFEVIEGAGHWVQYEAPDGFNGALLRVLQAAQKRTAAEA
jgi:pimeloyl-ACP methyl ester carboxylesterase